MKTTLKMWAPERVENNERWNDLVGKSVRIYPNPKAQKKLIMKENKAKPGIYLWTNLTNGKSAPIFI